MSRSSTTRIRRLVTTLLVPVAAFAMLAMPTSPASASGATSYGFDCSSTYHWVRQNWPNITTNGSAYENVWFDADLYRWNAPTQTWVFYRSTGWMGGASNYSGRTAVGYFGGLPYYFLYGTTRNVAPQTGVVFTNLPVGYYRTAEFYQTANGTSWSTWSHVQGSTAAYCQA